MNADSCSSAATRDTGNASARCDAPARLNTGADVVAGLGGALRIAFAAATSFCRARRCHWGSTRDDAGRPRPGDELVPAPAWSWTHAIAIEAPAERVWPWVAQIGQDKAGFYSYQWLENLAGCRIRNSSTVRPEWTELRVGGSFRLHPGAPGLRISAVRPGEHFVVSDVFDPTTGAPLTALPESGRLIRFSWLFLVESRGPDQSRFVSRYRVTYGQERWARWLYGPWLMEPVGFVMDRRMLMGVKERAEGSHRANPAPHQ